MFNTFQSPKIIFILPNIYECINGVSIKYKKFIQYLINAQYELTLIIPFINDDKFNDVLNNFKKYSNITLIKANGFNVPFYKEIKIPILHKKLIEDNLKNKNEIIIFNGEFIWLYTLLKKLKKKYKNIKLYPNMHTDYIHYANNYYNNLFFSNISIFKNLNITSVFNYTNLYLQEKIFSGIIVTGEQMKQKYVDFTESIFNANEIDLSIFHSHKIDLYKSESYKSTYNIFFCGRISEEKNIENILECVLLLYENIEISKNIDFNLHIIGSGPHLEYIKSLIETTYHKIKDNIVLYGELEHEDIYKLYHNYDNRIFLFTSLSETFGKTPMEACSTGIPIFIRRSELSESLYIHRKNAFLFDTPIDFLENFKYFINLNSLEKNNIIINSIHNVKKYEQIKIFDDWIYFLINGHLNRTAIINFVDMFTFHGLTKIINCSGMMLSD
jgi:glycosyltransferase involved in cell wall biosynthesis